MAGVIPGLILASMLGVTTFYRAWKNNYPRMPKATWVEALHAFRDSIWGLAADRHRARRHLRRLVHADRGRRHERGLCLRHRGVRLSRSEAADVPRVLLSSANMSAMILYIITNAVLFSFLMTSEQIPQAMTAWVTGTGIGWIEFLLFVNVLLLVAGNVMEPSSIVLITAPILFPVAVGLGIHPVHLGILMTVNMEVGLAIRRSG